MRRISLFALGGLTESTRESENARDEFLIVGIGPFTSLVLAGGFWVLARATAPLGTAPALVLGYAGWANLFLAIFNTIPAYPLDGGRLLRSVLWAVTGAPHRATLWAARVGQGFALLLGALALGPYVGVLDSPLGPSIFNALIAFFLFRGATAATERATARKPARERHGPARSWAASRPRSIRAGPSVRASSRSRTDRRCCGRSVRRSSER